MKQIPLDVWLKSQNKNQAFRDSLGKPKPTRFEFTIFTNHNGNPLSKSIVLEGGKPVSTPAAKLSEGFAEHIVAHGLAQVAKVIEACAPSQALALGVVHPLFRPDAGERVPVVVKGRVAKTLGAIARTAKYLQFDEGPGQLLLDHDRKGISPVVSANLAFAGGVIEALCEVFPQLRDAGRIVRASTSAGLVNAKTGERFTDSGGLHIYIAVVDARDIPRALDVAHKRLVLANLGWVFIGKAGRQFIRSPVDATVGRAERLVFEGAPILAPPLVQDAEKRRCEVVEGELLDTREAFPDLTPAEAAAYAAKVAELKGISEPEAKKVREEDDERVAQAIARKHKIDIKVARQRVALRHQDRLAPELEIEFDDPAIGKKSVAEIYSDPERYEGERVADPYAGRVYGICAKIMRDAQTGRPFIHSFAHGGGLYWLLPGCPEVENALRAAPADRVPEIYASLIVDAEGVLSVTDVVRLRDLAKDRSRVGVRDLNRAVAVERKTRAARRAAQLAEEARANDPRVYLPAPRSKDEEVLPLASMIDEALSKVKGRDRPLRDTRGDLISFEETKLTNFHALRSATEIEAGADMPPPTMVVMRRADQTQIGLTIERHVALDSGKGILVAPQENLCRAVNALTWSQTKIPPCAGYQALPLVLPDKSLRGGQGYDSKTQLMFRVPRELDRLVSGRRSVSLKQAREAYDFLANDWLADVLTDDFGKAGLIAVCLTIIERHLLDERICAVVSALQAKTGKTTAIRMICAAVLGDNPPARPWSDDEVERQKNIFAVALEGVATVVFDNLQEGAKIDSAALCAAVTSPTIANRVLGVSKTAQADSRFVPIFTGNSITPVGDLASRTIVVKMVANDSQPENRAFRHPSPVDWTKMNRGKILAALYAILQVERTPRACPKSRFKAWDQLVAHPIEVVSGIDLTEGFTRNESADEGKRPLARTLGLIHAAFGDREFSAKAMHDIVANAGSNSTARELLNVFRRDAPVPSPRSVGKSLKKLVGIFVAYGGQEYALVSRFDTHLNVWLFRVSVKLLAGFDRADFESVGEVIENTEEMPF